MAKPHKWGNLLEKRERIHKVKKRGHIHKVKKRGHKLSTRKRSSSMQKQKTYKDCDNSIISEEDCAIPTHLGPWPSLMENVEWANLQKNLEHVNSKFF